MREVLVTDLVKNVLGPKGGPNEELDDKHKPIVEYICGVLSPIRDYEENEEAETSLSEKAERKGKKSMESFHDDDDDNVILRNVMNPSLNPDKQPSTMGISFHCRSNGDPTFSICLTWARYLPDAKEKPTWKRLPKYTVIDNFSEKDGRKLFDSNGNEVTDENDSEISLRSRIKEIRPNEYFVSFFLTNRIVATEQDQPSRFRIFQPQIRVVQAPGTEIIPMESQNISDDEKELFFLYRDMPVFARGYMTSATWKDIDPEIRPDGQKVDFSECLDEPGFKWTDSETVPKNDRVKFEKADVRTEYVPMYSVPAPQIEWMGPEQDLPELSAANLAESWDRNKLRKNLEPLIVHYEKWANDQKNTEQEFSDITSRIKEQQTEALERMKIGIDLLCGKEGEDEKQINKDARLAFCFANKTLSTQYDWGHPDDVGGFRYRPFQLAFILMSIESVINKESVHRKICDLLWVPTGAGKTEAYLALVALLMAYCRIVESREGKTSVGTKIISRYTLRMLTIQQFRRTLTLFTAAEYLRVHNLYGEKIGWVPQGYDGGSLIWGTVPFRVGLWVGTGVTPNKLERGKYPGALDHLAPENKVSGAGDPAQIINCPQCDGLLSVPEMGLEPKTKHVIHWTVRCDADTNQQKEIEKLHTTNFNNFQISKVEANPIREKFLTISLHFTRKFETEADQIFELWKEIRRILQEKGIEAKLASTSASRPGYFYRKRARPKSAPTPYDFDIFCPNPKCKLHTESDWIGTAPMGSVNGREPLPKNQINEFGKIKFTKNFLIEPPECFRNPDFSCDRIPIPALTVDEQVYKYAPTMIVSTVDKFARLPFEPKTGCIFGNLEWYHMTRGYYRLFGTDMDDKKHLDPHGKKNERPYRRLDDDEIPDPPQLIIQDELHLIDGPLGSMVGLYETAVDILSSHDGSKLKYIASTATIRNGEEHVKSLFDRSLQIFPPKGLHVSDRFFIQERKTSVLDDKSAGRLYVGLSAPGKGGLTPIVRIWSRLAQTAFEKRDHPEIDRFWTMTGYFNAVRELAGARALYRQDIIEELRGFGKSTRELLDENSYELSGRTPSENLPSILDTLNKSGEDAADALFTTSMFGTGVDVPRLGLMLVNGQPKTTSSYIQSTGRVGRKKGALVVTFFRTSKPRDLSHFEFFNRNHVQLHRTVEAPTVSPFSASAVERSIGPLLVGILRNMRNLPHPWQNKDSALIMREPSISKSKYIEEIFDRIELRAQSQPGKRSPPKDTVRTYCITARDKWKQDAEDIASASDELDYVEYGDRKKNVVLGDPLHSGPKNKNAVVFSNAPNSLRDIEGEVSFET